MSERFLIPGASARAFPVYKGQRLRVSQEESGAVPDIIAFNLKNFKECLSPGLTRSLNGNLLRFKELYTRTPFSNLMFRVVDYPFGLIWSLGTGCNGAAYQKKHGIAGYVGCRELLAGAISEYGLGPEDVPDTTCLFMDVKLKPEDGTYYIGKSRPDRKEHAEFSAEMDSLVAISSCPGMIDAKAKGDWRRGGKTLKIEIA